VIEVARVIGIAARSDLANLPLPPAWKRLTFMLAGFVNNRHFVYRVTNMENAEGVVSREAGEPFDIFTAIWPEGWVQRKTDLTIVGAELALDDTIDRRLGTFRKDSVRRPPAEVADMMVNLIRAAARHGKYGKYIGRCCMSIVVPREGTSPARTIQTKQGRHSTSRSSSCLASLSGTSIRRAKAAIFWE
jgi:hypothetical protein